MLYTLFYFNGSIFKRLKIIWGVFFLLAINWLLVQVPLSYSLMKKPASERHLTLAPGGRRS